MAEAAWLAAGRRGLCYCPSTGGGTRLLQRPGLCRWRGPWGLVLFSGGHWAPHALVLLCPSFLLTAVCSERYWGHRGDTSQEGGTPPSRGHLGSGSGLGLATSSSPSCCSDLPVCWLPGSEPGGALTAPLLPSLSPGSHLSGRPPSPLAGLSHTGSLPWLPAACLWSPPRRDCFSRLIFLGPLLKPSHS